MPHWVEMEFAEPIDVSEVIVRGRRLGDARIRDLDLGITTADGVVSESVVGNEDIDTPIDIEPVEAQRIRVTVHSQTFQGEPRSFADLAEIEVYDSAGERYDFAGQNVHNMAIDLDGGNVTTYVDGELLFETSESAYDTGFIGFRTSNAGGPAFVDNVVVTAADGEVLFADDFESGVNPFVGDGTTACDAETVDGRLRIPSGNWCRLSPVLAVIDNQPN